MRTCLIGVLLAVLCGCDMRGTGPTAQERRAPDAAKVAAAKKSFEVFLAEAGRGLELLGKHPSHDALRAEANKLHELLNAAGDAAPTDAEMGDLTDAGRQLLRFFDACLKTADHQARQKDASPERIQKAIDWTCNQNAAPIREGIDQLRTMNAEIGTKKEQ